MRVNVKRTALAAVLLAGVSTSAWAAGLFQTLPIIGGAAYCAASNVSGAAQTTITGQGGGVAAAGQTTGTVICNVSAPAGPATFAGTEVIPMDLYPPGVAVTAGGAQTALANINQLGQGPIIDNTAVGAAQTIPNNTGFFVLDTGTPATFAVTMPALAIEGQIVHLVCGVATVTTLTVTANTGQTMKGPAATTCATAAGFTWRFSAAVPNNLAGTPGVIVANSWVRIQ